jgi:hypothetical protein
MAAMCQIRTCRVTRLLLQLAVFLGGVGRGGEDLDVRPMAGPPRAPRNGKSLILMKNWSPREVIVDRVSCLIYLLSGRP